MCGIFGYYLKDKYNELFKNDEEIFSRFIKLISHRGPDNQNKFINSQKNVGLFHSRLSIIDTSQAGHQPMFNIDNRFVFIYNGEIYNYKELKKELCEKTKIKWHSSSDTEVLFNFLINGSSKGQINSKSLIDINGIFSFAFYDNKYNSLTLARDPLGVKPLYYADTKIGLFFASEIKALLPLTSGKYRGVISNDIDKFSIDKYLTYLFCPGEGTSFKEIKKLSPGSYLRIKDGNILEIDNWYKTKNQKSNINLTSEINKKDTITQTRNLIKNAVQRQMISEVPLGAFLSGGLDSSTIVNFAKEIDPEIKCFTINVRNKEKPEDNIDLKYAIKVAKYLEVPIEIVDVEAKDFLNEIENMIWILDEPIADPSPLNVMFISRYARKCGIKVLLSGAGGDDIFSGYRRHKALILDRYIQYLPKDIKKIISKFSRNLPVKFVSLRKLRKFLSTFDLDGNEKIISYFNWINRSDLIKLYSDDFKNTIDKEKPAITMHQFLNDFDQSYSNLQKILLLEQRYFLGDHNLIYNDKMSMNEGLEIRVPFLDKNLIEFANSLPDYFKQKNFENKWILKKSMEGILPNDIIYRKKTGFGLPLRSWLKDDLKDWLRELLSKKNIQKRGLFNYNSINNLIEDNEKNKIDATYTLFSLACQEIWFQKFIDNSSKF